MKPIKINRKSIAFKMTSLILVIVVGQIILLSFFLVFGGILDQAKKNAYYSFAEKVRNRRDYLQSQMNYHWTNMDPYIEKVSSFYDQEKKDDVFFTDISDTLISMLRMTQATGVFVVRNGAAEEKSAIYIRDYDPVLNDYNNRDLFLVYGPAELGNKLQIPLDQIWRYKLNLDETFSDFYQQPLSKVDLSSDSKLLGYWSLPFKLSEKDITIFTYTMPLFDKDNQIIGVIGVEISEQQMSKYLPGTDLKVRDSYGYMLGYRPQDDVKIEPVFLTKAIQHRIIKEGTNIERSLIDSDNSIYLLNNDNIKGKIYTVAEELQLYRNNTPFQQNKWYLIGLINEKDLLSYVNKIEFILIISLILSACAGIITGYIASYKLTKPIIDVAKKVKSSDQMKEISLHKTGLLEVDALSQAIEYTSNLLLQTSGRMSRIIEMVGIPLGVFEFSEEKDTVFLTDQVAKLLDLTETEQKEIDGNKELFIKIIENILCNPEEGEDDIYYTGDTRGKWLKIKYAQKGDITLGVIMNTTEEIIEKKKIINDRDIDPLTGIYNRKAMQLHMEEALDKRERKLISALFMFDLDNLKQVNDTYGHKWGDIYIKLAVKHLSKINVQNKIIGRRSGDEFTLLIYDQESKEEIRNCIDLFYNNMGMDNLTFPDGKTQCIMISGGLIWVEDRDYAFDEYFQKADDLLYEAKRNCKGFYCESEMI